MCQKMDNKGFTLIELLVVMAMMAIVMTTAFYYIGNKSDRAVLKKEARDLASYLKLARVSAVRDTHAWAIQFDTVNRRYQVFRNSGEPFGSESWTEGNEDVYMTVTLPDSVSFVSGAGMRTGATVLPADGISYSANRVVFNPNGTSESGTVYLSIGTNETYAVSSLSTTGRIKIWKNLDGTWTDR